MTLNDKSVLITGGTGSLGKVLTQRILTNEIGKPKKIIIFSRDEAKQHDMRLKYKHKVVATDEIIYHNFEELVEFRIGDVRDYHSIASAAKDADIADIKSPIIGLLIMFYYIVINEYLFSISDIFNFIIIPLFFMNGILVCSQYWQDKYYNNNFK